jgi:hypothetical protein
MAGKRHHIVPRLLQRGFASRIQGDTVLTWLYRKKGSVSKKEVSTKDIMLSENFYGKKGSINADDEITQVENKLAPLINKLRNGKCDIEESKTEIAELIAHLSVRTKLVREGFTKMSKQMIGGMKEIFTDENNIENVLLNPPQNFLETQIEEVLTDKNNEELANAIELFDLLGLEKDDVKKMVTQLTYSAFSEEESKNEIIDLVKGLFSQIFDESNPLYPQSIKEGHNKSLAENTIPLMRVKKYEQFDWKVYKVTPPLILGDAGCIFRENGEILFKPSCDIENTSQIYLPISTNQILIGTNNSAEIETDIKVINEALAKCTYEQFICSEKSDDKVNLIQFIGMNTNFASDDEIEKELDEIRNNMNKIYEDN